MFYQFGIMIEICVRYINIKNLKMVDYFITGVWKNPNGNITDVFLHENGESGFKKGIKASEKSVIQLINKGKSIKTLIWNYPDWKQKAEVIVVQDYLRTKPNGSEKDNLDNLIDMNAYNLKQNG